MGLVDTSRLRLETAEDHERVEALLPLTSPALTASGYRAMLRGLWGFIKGWEQWAARCAPPSLAALVEARQRSSLLALDLRFFGDEAPGEVRQWLTAACPAGEADFLGRMYVVEGSTLGGQLIARHVESALALKPGRGDAYFRGYGEQTGAMWKQFKAELERLPEGDLPVVIEAARQTFRDFEAWMKPTVWQGGAR